MRPTDLHTPGQQLGKALLTETVGWGFVKRPVLEEHELLTLESQPMGKGHQQFLIIRDLRIIMEPFLLLFYAGISFCRMV